MEAALKYLSFPCILNSTHLEHGTAVASRVFDLAKEHGSAVILLTIDEDGMAKTANRKLEIARRLYDLAVSNQKMQPEDLIFDVLTFTLATGDPLYANSAVETLNAIPMVKESLPGVLTSLGISNISFGFSPEARLVLNNIMLEQAIARGLDLCIFNPAHRRNPSSIAQNERTLAENLIFNRSTNALQEIAVYFRKKLKRSD
jgi:5-methyltetrahydrofolate--homocysteine methyltransferase